MSGRIVSLAILLTLIAGGVFAQFQSTMMTGGSIKQLPVVSSQPSGPAPPIPPPAGMHWSLTFDDEFNGTSIDPTKWFVPAANAPYVNEGGGVVTLTSAPATVCTTPCQRSYMDTTCCFSQKYGYFEWRAKMPTNASGEGQDLWPALWMLPVNSSVMHTPQCADDLEPDVNEIFGIPAGGDPTQTSYTIHDCNVSPTANYPSVGVDLSAAFHKYALYWNNDGTGVNGSMTIYFDDVAVPGSFHTLTDTTGQTNDWNNGIYLIQQLIPCTTYKTGCPSSTKGSDGMEVDDARVWHAEPGSGGLTPPAQATMAGFTTLAYNFDFSQTQYANPATNWVDCGSPATDTTKIWHQGNPGVDTSALCDTSHIFQTNDPVGGQRVLDLHWNSADDGRFTGNSSFVSIQTVTKGGVGQGGTALAYFPNFYIEAVYRIDNISASCTTNCNTSGPNGVWTWQTGGQDWEWDIAELYGNSGGFGDECGGNCTWATYSGPTCAISNCGQNVPNGWAPNVYHKYGELVTSDGAAHTYGCGWIDDVFQAGCYDRGISNFPQWLIMWIGGHGANSTQLPTTNEYIQYVNIWSCASFATTQCNGSTLSSSTVNGAPLLYYH